MAGSPMNLKQVAAELGVHYMTAYRYVRTGRLDASRHGTEWVVDADAVARFLAARARDHDTAAATTSGDRLPADWAARLARALEAGDETAAWRVLQQALASGRSPTDCYLEVLSGALALIGQGADDRSGAYIATATASRLVARLGARFRRPGRPRGTVVFGAASGEHHSLPIAIVADLVRIEGYTCLELGPDVPPEVFAEATTNAARLVAVGIGTTSADNIASVRATIDAVRAVRPDVAVILGGQGVRNPDIASLAGATHWAADGAEAVAVIRALSPTPRRARSTTST